MKLVTSTPSKPALMARRAASTCSRMQRLMSSRDISRGGRKCGSVCGTTEGCTQ